MNRITKAFERTRAGDEKALIPYLTAGFPAPSRTVALLRALVRGGADIIELGVPFSDPIADGPTIQRACAEALEAGTSLEVILHLLKQFREKDTVTPIVLFGAYNPFFHYGMERFARDASESGADALLIPDLPAEEAGEVIPVADAAGLCLIQLVAPTTPADRKAQIARQASGFVYYVSLKGVTGARTDMRFELEKPLAELRAATTLPVAVGFGIATPDQAGLVARVADAVVVGSALVDLASRNREAPDLEEQVEAYIRSMKEAVRRSSSGTARTA